MPASDSTKKHHLFSTIKGLFRFVPRVWNTARHPHDTPRITLRTQYYIILSRFCKPFSARKIIFFIFFRNGTDGCHVRDLAERRRPASTSSQAVEFRQTSGIEARPEDGFMLGSTCSKYLTFQSGAWLTFEPDSALPALCGAVCAVCDSRSAPAPRTGIMGKRCLTGKSVFRRFAENNINS